MRSAVEERGSSCRKTSRSRHSGRTFSIPITVTSTSGSVVHMRPLPSDSTTQIVPVSAIPKFAPLVAIGTVRNFSRRCWRAASAIALASQPRCWPLAIVRSNSARISARFLWIAGTRMCDEDSCASWMISSARSVSIASIPWSASASLSPISSVASDLTLISSRAPWSWAMPATMRFASAASRAQCTTPPARVTEASRRSSCSGSVAIARALIALPASRNASQSGTSATALRALGADGRGRLADVAAQLGVGAASRARRRESLTRCRQDLGEVDRAHAGPLALAARRRCASGTSCRPTCRPPRPCRARGAACRRASPSRCRRS